MYALGSASAVAPPPPPRGNVTPALDAVPSGTVAVVASSAPVLGRVAIVVQNGSAAPVRNVRVTALATRADGGRATKASTNDLIPSTLVPGAIALGVVEFAPRDVRTNPALTFQVKSSRARSSDAPNALDVRDLVLSPPLTGNVAQRLDLIVANTGSRAVRGPLLVRVVCFGESARPSEPFDRAVRASKLAAGGTRAVSVDLQDLCPTHLVAARGAPVPSSGRR
jgi:hypothetical protein